MKTKRLTLCIIHKGSKILLGMKKRGFGEGRWNGFGGKVQPGESLEAAARREVQEEAGLRVPELEQLGNINFHFAGESEVLEVNIFKAVDFEGEPVESEEMRPQWFSIDALPYRQMWPDDLYWLPLLLENKKFRGKFVFEGHDRILEHEIKLI